MMQNLTGYKKIIAWIGFITGIFNLFFWLIMIALYYIKDYGDPLFNNKFYTRCYYWGIVTIFIFSIAILLELFL